MRNAPVLPTVAIIAAFVAGAIAVVPYLRENPKAPDEMAIFWITFAVSAMIFGVQGLISVLVEGQELHLGRVPPRLTALLSILIALLTFALVGVAIGTGYGIFAGWTPRTLGIFFGLGSIVLALQLIFYKEAFIGDESRFDEREDGTPW